MFTSTLAAFSPASSAANTFYLAAEPSSATLSPGQQSNIIDVFLVEEGSTVLADIGLSLASLKVAMVTPPDVNPLPAEIITLLPGPAFTTTSSPDPTPGVITVFSPDANLFGVKSSTGRVHIASFAVSVPSGAEAGSPTRFTISSIDALQFLALDDFSFADLGTVGDATFEVNGAAAPAVPLPSSAFSASALLAAMSLRRRRPVVPASV